MNIAQLSHSTPTVNSQLPPDLPAAWKRGHVQALARAIRRALKAGCDPRRQPVRPRHRANACASIGGSHSSRRRDADVPFCEASIELARHMPIPGYAFWECDGRPNCPPSGSLAFVHFQPRSWIETRLGTWRAAIELRAGKSENSRQSRSPSLVRWHWIGGRERCVCHSSNS